FSRIYPKNMVFLALTRSGLDEAIALNENADGAIWCGCDVITEYEFSGLNGRNISRFNFALFGADDETFSGALATIADHHPNERVWIESVSI
ncbi:hypothetical protein, partial [Collimonas fungivorans]|uniref:hypothetical protein n=1 Tax=Collimonas fungivorans TaxID=158899 RepID=UPI003FA34863